MTHCTNCGVQMGGNVGFCPNCGTAANTSASVLPEANDAKNNKVMAVLAYLGVLVLVPIFAAKESRFARYHANQGLVLLLAEIAYGVVASILSSIFTALLFSSGAWGVWTLLNALLGLIWLVFLVLSIIGIVAAVNGACKPLPVIGKITLLK